MSSLKKIVVDRPLLKFGCTLGEGHFILGEYFLPNTDIIIGSAPIYDATTSTLHFVDIEQNKV
jgi:hypothetical protein